jgi:hypothetical protein
MKRDIPKKEMLKLATGSESRPIKDCYWIVPDRFLAGEYPRDKDKQTSEEKIKALLRIGVNWFVDLTKLDDRYEPYIDMVRRLGGDRVFMKRFPVHDDSFPYSRIQTAEILNTIDYVIEQKGIVYLHCWGGTGRTGTIVGHWLTRHGHKEEAIKCLNKL